MRDKWKKNVVTGYKSMSSSLTSLFNTAVKKTSTVASAAADVVGENYELYKEKHDGSVTAEKVYDDAKGLLIKTSSIVNNKMAGYYDSPNDLVNDVSEGTLSFLQSIKKRTKKTLREMVL